MVVLLLVMLLVLLLVMMVMMMMLDDAVQVELLMTTLGLYKVGWVFSQSVKEREYIMSSSEVQQMAAIQVRGRGKEVDRRIGREECLGCQAVRTYRFSVYRGTPTSLSKANKLL
jgi:hypothetical protein